MEFRISELNDTNIKQICRTCLTINKTQMISIFDEIEQMNNDENVKTHICDMLMDVALIELNRKDSLPTLICINCLQLAQLLFNFKKQCNRSQAILLEYLTEKENKVIGTLTSGKNSNLDGDIFHKTFAIKESIGIEKTSNEIKHENIIIKNEVHEFSNPSSSDDLLNTTIKVEFDDEIIKSDTEKDDKVIGTLGTEKSSNQDCKVLNIKSAIKQSLDIEKSSNENKYESMLIENDVHYLSNSSTSNHLLNACLKLDSVDEIIESDIECKETLHSKVLICQLCNKSFQTDTLYFAHMKDHPEDKYVCNVCNKHLKCSWNLTVHMRTHTNEKHYSCKICGKQFKHSSSVTAHMRIHDGPAHMRIHDGLRSILCSVCGKGFRDSTTLKYHMRTHTKEKPYMCDICGITVSMRGKLEIHMRTHSEERRFKCTECDKAFRLATMLKRHSIIHTGLKPFSCDVCKKSFNRQSTLRLHEKIHKNEKPHTCPVCGKSFIQAICLRRHLENHK